MKELAKLPISEKELCDRYEKTWTPAVNDVLRELGYIEQTLPNNIMPLREHMRVCGVAFTIKGSKNLTQEGEMEKRADMLEALGEDTVCMNCCAPNTWQKDSRSGIRIPLLTSPP